MACPLLTDDLSSLYSGPFTALGSELLSGVVSLLYEKLFQHEATRRFFEGKDRTKIQRHMAGFLSCALSRSSNPALSPKQVWFIHRHMLRGYQPLAPKRLDSTAEHKRTHASQYRLPQRHASLPELWVLGAAQGTEPAPAQDASAPAQQEHSRARPACPAGSHSLRDELHSASELPAEVHAAAAVAVGWPSLEGLCTSLSDEHQCCDSCSSAGSVTAGGCDSGSGDDSCGDSCPVTAKPASTEGEGCSQGHKSAFAQGMGGVACSQGPKEGVAKARLKPKPSVSFSGLPGGACPMATPSVFGGVREEGPADSCPFAAKPACADTQCEEGAACVDAQSEEGSCEGMQAAFKQRPSVSFSGLRGDACLMASAAFGGVREEKDVLGPHHAHVMMHLLRDTLAELGAEPELTEGMSNFLAQSGHVFERGDFFHDPDGREAEWQRKELEKKVRQQPVAGQGLEGARSKSFNSKSGTSPRLSRMGNMCLSCSAHSCTNLGSRQAVAQAVAKEEQVKAEKANEDMRAIFASW